MSLPPPPRNLYCVTSTAEALYTATQMQAYGQQCRAAALEEATQVCDLHADGDNDATYCA